MVTDLTRGRHAGILLPLFSAVSTRGWGIGEIGDVPAMGRWLRRAGFDLWLMLPVNEMSPGQHSPYSAMTAMAIDPIYLTLEAVEDFAALGGEACLAADERARIAAVRGAAVVQYDEVRRLKVHALRRAFEQFVHQDLATRSHRSAVFHDFVAAQAWWLEDFALFRALHAGHGEKPWWEWDEGVRTHRFESIRDWRERLAHDVQFHRYVQWQADLQWRHARAETEVAIFGDLPFMVSADSADVWARQHAFRFDATIGVPPDAFSETGQDWGLPVYRWDVIAEDDYEWIRQRARRSADLFRGFRIDHLVGLFRTYAIPVDGGERSFSPPDQPSQVKQGEALLRIFGETGARVIAEDLGTVPDFVRASIAKLRVPGYKVLRWEREWDAPGQPFRDPARFPALSLATTGTHDTEPIAEWWEAATVDERRAFAHIPGLAGQVLDVEGGGFGERELTAVLELIYGSGSDLVVLPVQDLFGWRHRINVPATVGDGNWNWRLPWPVDEWVSRPDTLAVAERLHDLASHHGRLRHRPR
jgi:4-alpha-glucanotransferase